MGLKTPSSAPRFARVLLLLRLQMLIAEPGIEAQRITRRPMTPEETKYIQKTPEGTMFLQNGQPAEYWGATLTRTAQKAKRPVIEHIPAECVWIVADANSVDTAKAVFHVRDTAVSDLIEASLPEFEVLAHHRHADERPPATAVLSPAIVPRASPSSPRRRPATKAQRPVRCHVEGWMRCGRWRPSQ